MRHGHHNRRRLRLDLAELPEQIVAVRWEAQLVDDKWRHPFPVWHLGDEPHPARRPCRLKKYLVVIWMPQNGSCARPVARNAQRPRWLGGTWPGTPRANRPNATRSILRRAAVRWRWRCWLSRSALALPQRHHPTSSLAACPLAASWRVLSRRFGNRWQPGGWRGWLLPVQLCQQRESLRGELGLSRRRGERICGTGCTQVALLCTHDAEPNGGTRSLVGMSGVDRQPQRLHCLVQPTLHGQRGPEVERRLGRCLRVTRQHGPTPPHTGFGAVTALPYQVGQRQRRRCMKWLIRIGLGNDSAKETFGVLEIPLGLDQLAEVRHGQAHGFGVLAPLDRFPQDLLVRLSGEVPRRIGVTSQHHVQAPDRCLMNGHAFRGVDHGLAERCQPSHRLDIAQPNRRRVRLDRAGLVAPLLQHVPKIDGRRAAAPVDGPPVGLLSLSRPSRLLEQEAQPERSPVTAQWSARRRCRSAATRSPRSNAVSPASLSAVASGDTRLSAASSSWSDPCSR